MLDVLKNLGKLLVVAVLAGLLGALGGYLINNFMADDKPAPPTSTTLSPPPSTRPSTPKAGEETLPADRENSDQGKPEKSGAEEPGPAVQLPPPTTAPRPPASTAPKPVPAPEKPQAAKPEKSTPPEQTVKPKTGGKTTVPDSKATEKPKEADKKTAGKKTREADQVSGTAKPASGGKPAAAEKTKPRKPTPPESAKKTKPKEKTEKSKPPSFEEMVEAKREKVLLVKSVSASTVDRTVVIRVALNRSAEPKLSRLIGRGTLRIVLDFENAVRIKGRVPDVIKSPNSMVKGIRIGAHPDKLRIVVDLDPKLTYALNQHQFSRAYVLEIKPQTD